MTKIKSNDIMYLENNKRQSNKKEGGQNYDICNRNNRSKKR